MNVLVPIIVMTGILQTWGNPATYAAVYAQASDNDVIAIYVGSRCKEIAGLFTCWEPTFYNDPTNRLVVGTKRYWIADLPVTAGYKEVYDAVQAWNNAQRAVARPRPSVGYAPVVRRGRSC